MLVPRCWALFFLFLVEGSPTFFGVLMMPWSHQTFRLVPAVKLLGIRLRIRCWEPTTFHDITVGDVNGWCLNGQCEQPPLIQHDSWSGVGYSTHNTFMFRLFLVHALELVWKFEQKTHVTSVHEGQTQISITWHAKMSFDPNELTCNVLHPNLHIKKREEKVTPLFRYRRDCEPFSMLA